jgi:acyl-CoA synthetase (AMP-forming)/AMP-acid ligase II
MFDGYWDEPELTAKVLKSDPIKPELEEFKSGDLCYRDELGNYYFVGRCDDQVKINGNRVELDDIASVVQEHPKIRHAIVTCTKKDNQVSELNLFVLAEDNENNIDISAEKLRCYCRSSLPEYMVPKKIIFVTEFKFNENGKIDRHKLNNLIS